MTVGPNENTDSRNRLAEKVAVVSGAGSIGEGWGNGKAAAFVYGKEGAKTFCVDYRLEAAEETKGAVVQVKNVGGTLKLSNPDASPSDVADPKSSPTA